MLHDMIIEMNIFEMNIFEMNIFHAKNLSPS